MTPPLRHGEPWGQAAQGPADMELAGDDRDLAALAERHPGTLVRFHPSDMSDLARAVGLGVGAATDAPMTTEVLVDALSVSRMAGDSRLAVNAVVLGSPPDRVGWLSRARELTVTIDGREWFSGRATTVLVANGQYVRGHDLVPRGHPGDGWAEVQVFALRRSERPAMRRRLRTGTHVPHPRIRQGRARRVDIEVSGALAGLEIDGVTAGPVRRLHVAVVPGAIRLLL